MKTYIIPALLALFIITGCSSTKKVSDYDDVYYSSRKEKKLAKQEDMKTADPDYYVKNEDNNAEYKMEEYDAGEYVSYEDEPVYSDSETIESPDGNTYITNNYYGPGGYGDYYDYSYSARINRFYSPYNGFGYYSPWYVGFYYDPWYYNPYWYSPSWYFGFSWGWGGMGWGYPYYGYPYYYPYNSYWYGYNHGYWDGYYAAQYWDYGNNSYYYGPRKSRGGNNSPHTSYGSNSPYASGGASTYAERNKPVLSSGIVSVPASTNTGAGARNENANVVSNPRGGQGINTVSTRPATSGNSLTDKNTAGRNVSGAAAATSASTSVKPERQVQNVESKPATQDAKPRYTYKKPESAPTTEKYKPGEAIDARTRTQPEQRYSKPETFNADRNTTRTVNTNTNQRSSLYSKPSSNSSNSYSRPSQNVNRYSQPSRSETRSYSQPSRSNVNSYSQPSRSSSSYSRPASTGSSRSSYSRPSSSSFNRSSSSSGSSRSYSTPSRSSSGSSGGGSSRGGRR